MRRAAVLAACASTLLVATPAAADRADRTKRIPLGVYGAGDGESKRPAMTGDGLYVVYDSVATNLADDPNGATRDVFLHNTQQGFNALVSRAPGGPGADGPSLEAVVSAGGPNIAFTSYATNLFAGDANAAADVFVRRPGGLDLVSATPSGAPGNGGSTQPAITADGRLIVFSSEASDLVAGDDNEVQDIFVRDLETGGTALLSRARGGAANRASANPEISSNGRFATFSSAASNLVAGDDNGETDVFRVHLGTGTIKLISVSSRERQQNASVEAPFLPVSDVSDDGRFVVFDSDASNLVRRDTNRDTDVFLRDTRRETTTRVSVDRLGKQADNDSFSPSLTPSGRHVAFESFAENLSPFDARGEDVFVYDRRTRNPILIDVPTRAARRDREQVRQLLQRPFVTDDGLYGLFSSSANNIAGVDGNGAVDVFLRDLRPIRTRLKVTGRRYRITADRAATLFLCKLDARATRTCKRRGRLRGVTPGRHALRVIAFGAGAYFGKTVVRRFTAR